MSWLMCAAVMLAGVLASASASTMGSDADDAARLSVFVAQIERDYADFLHGVRIHVIDPSLYVQAVSAGLPRSVDMSGLYPRLRARAGQEIPPHVAMRILREMPVPLYHGEASTGVYPMPDGSTLCLITASDARGLLHDAVEGAASRTDVKLATSSSVNSHELARFLLYHELAHCGEDPRRQRGAGWTSYDTYRAENIADAFAVLMHLRETRDDAVPRFFAQLRRVLHLADNDAEHMTTPAIDAAYEEGMVRVAGNRLRGLDARAILALARDIAERHALNQENYRRMEAKAAAEWSSSARLNSSRHARTDRPKNP